MTIETTADVDLRDAVARRVREQVRLNLGPNALAEAQKGRPVRLSGGEADSVADAVMAVIEDRPGCCDHGDRTYAQMETHFTERLAGVEADIERLRVRSEATVAKLTAGRDQLSRQLEAEAAYQSGLRDELDRIRDMVEARLGEAVPDGMSTLDAVLSLIANR